MRAVEPVRLLGTVVDVVVPSGPGRLAGVSMAGFRGRAENRVELQVVPHPALTMIFDFGDTLFVDEISGESKQGSVVVSMAPGRLRGAGRDADLLQVRLSPVAAHAVLGVSSELGGTVVALDDLWGRDGARAQHLLHTAKSWEDRFAAVTDLLARRQEAGGAVDPEIAWIWGRMTTSRGQDRVEPLAAEVGWSRKRLWSRFRSQIGLTPKRAATLIRFDHVAHRLAAGHSAAQVAAESGFTDQSHLHRDVMAFTGMTPTAVAGAPWLAVDDIAWRKPSSH